MHHTFIWSRLTASQRQTCKELNFWPGDTGRMQSLRRCDSPAIAEAAAQVLLDGLSVAAAARHVFRALNCHPKTAERLISKHIAERFRSNGSSATDPTPGDSNPEHDGNEEDELAAG